MLHLFALWDSKTGKLAANREGTTILSAFKSPFDEPQLSRPSLLYPASGDTLLSKDTCLVWHSVPGATSYEIQLSTQSTFASIVVDSAEIADTLFSLTRFYSPGSPYMPGPDSLGLNMKYFSRITATGSGIYSQQWSFVTPSHVTGVKVGSQDPPRFYTLSQNYPNPFNPSTIISYEVPKISHVTITVYNVLGRKVSILTDAIKTPGDYEVLFDGSKFASGVYIYAIDFQSNDGKAFVCAKKALLLK